MGFDLEEGPDLADLQGQVVAAKLTHAIDLIRGEIETVRALQEHYKEFTDHRLKSLEDDVRDHEQRIRAATDGVTQFKTFHTLASGGSSFMSLLALLKSFFLP
jgi:hypothetical protein